MSRVLNIGLAALAVVEIAAAVYVVSHNDAPKSQALGGGRSTPPATRTSSAPNLGIDATSATQPTAHRSPVVAFLGDDWTTGAGASAKSMRFTTLVSRALGVRERNFGGDGTGYAKSGTDAGPYRQRIDEIAAAHPAVVVVTGGRNDRFDNAATAAEQAKRLFGTLHQKLPDAVLIAVAPFWGDSDLPAELVALSAAIRKGVTAAGGTYLDIEDPIHGHPNLMADAADPNDAGYAKIASALEPQLAPLIPR